MVVYHPEAEAERAILPKPEKVAIRKVIMKLEVEGPMLLYPHQSKVIGSKRLRELRPRAGRSIWRLLCVRVNVNTFLVVAVAPEAQRDRRGFARAVRLAERRISEVV